MSAAVKEGNKKLSTEFLKIVGEVSEKIGIRPEWLLAVMAKETAGTFSPSIKNPSSSATGLIQFTEKTARGLDTSTAKLAKMTREYQMNYVYKYLKPFTGKLHSFADVYLAVFFPAAIRWPNNKRLPNWVYVANMGIDKAGKGYLTVGDFKKWIGYKTTPPVKAGIQEKKKNNVLILIAAGFFAYMIFNRK